MVLGLALVSVLIGELRQVILASEAFTWSLVEAFAVLGWLAGVIIVLRNRGRNVDPQKMMRQRRALVMLTLWAGLVAVRLATHTYG